MSPLLYHMVVRSRGGPRFFVSEIARLPPKHLFFGTFPTERCQGISDRAAAELEVLTADATRDTPLPEGARRTGRLLREVLSWRCPRQLVDLKKVVSHLAAGTLAATDDRGMAYGAAILEEAC